MPKVLCKGCNQVHDSMLVKCPEVIATGVPYGGKLVDIVQESAASGTRKLKVAMQPTKEIRVAMAREIVERKCSDPECWYRKQYEAKRAKDRISLKVWRSRRPRGTPAR